MKPIGSAQGKGIFLFTRLSEVSDWKTDFKAYKPGPIAPKGGPADDIEAYVVLLLTIHHTQLLPA